MREQGKNLVILDAGDALFSPKAIKASRSKSNLLKAKTIVHGYERIGCDAFNVGTHDLALGFEFIDSLQASTNLPFISANIVEKESGELIFKPYIIIKKGELKIGVIGLTDKIPAIAAGLRILDYKKTGVEYITKLQPQVDILVMLVNANRQDYGNLKVEFNAADYIFVSRYTGRTYPSSHQLEDGPFLYSVGVQGKWVAEIDLSIVDPRKPIIDISQSQENLKTVEKRFKSLKQRNPDKVLEDIYVDKPNVLKIIKDYRVKQEKAEKILANAVNRSEYRLTALDKKIADDPELVKLAKETLSECRKLDRITSQTLKKVRNQPS
ncbi:MAG: hypothetical protein KAK01_02305 [Candidatus Marinimicrobia bacterium]|nr:hypothetical protein [Candidatus Neomarinimicrobiota bacterium]